MAERVNPLNCQPTFCMTIPEEHDLAHIGLQSGDVLMCDFATEPARFVIGNWDNFAHVCTNIDGRLFDEGTHKFGPEDAEILGRVLYVSRTLVPQKESA